MIRPWAIHVGLLPDELFSMWLVRAALAQGCDPMHLTGALWPRWRAWTVDLDRGINEHRMTILAARSGVDASRLEGATLRPVLAAVAPSVKPEQATWPWVLAQGSRNRRRCGGLQFCPPCLAEDMTPYFRRSWRLAWHVGCVRHRTLLADHCGHCHALVEPHRVRTCDATLCRCPSCGHDLRYTTTGEVCPQALAFQITADQVLIHGHGTWLSAQVSREAWFQLAWTYAGGRLLLRGEDEVSPGITTLAMNMQRPSERVLRLRMAFRGMNGEPRGRSVRPTRSSVEDPRPPTLNATPCHTPGSPAVAQPQAKVQGDWVRLLRRLRLGHP